MVDVGAQQSRLLGRMGRMVPAQLGSGASEEESRARLQTRLTTLYKVMFWANATLLAFLQLMYLAYPEVEPRYNKWVFVMGVAAVASMAFVWRIALIREQRSFEILLFLDNYFTIGTGVVFGAAAAIAFDFRPSAYTCLIYQLFALLTRALLVPSTGRRTAFITAAAYIPMSVVSVFLAIYAEENLPPVFFIAGFVVVAIVTVILCAAGSSIIYGLRREVDAAVQLGRYKLDRLIGKGGLGEVYLAHHVMLRRPTAIKVLRPDRINSTDIARFVREVHATSRLTHPNTVAVFDYGPTVDGRSFYYAMEYLGGGLNLEELVVREGPQPAARIVAILVQVCGALEEAHGQGIVHRDITPTNIMLCERGGMPDVVKVLDFGLAQLFTAEIGDEHQALHGTPLYMAPETIDSGTVGPASDIYALGCVAYFLVTGKPPFEGKTPLEVCMKHVSDDPVAPATHAALAAVILRCLAKSPSERYATAQELADALTATPLDDWNEDRARSWWTAFAASPDEASASFSDVITVDVSRREAV
ncbi:MAG: serine/threonine-protein kinase [Kofleriaceae bacterium]